MRERLTARNKRGNAYYPYCFRDDTCDGFGRSEKCDTCEFDQMVCERLAWYEDKEYRGKRKLKKNSGSIKGVICRLMVDVAVWLDKRKMPF